MRTVTESMLASVVVLSALFMVPEGADQPVTRPVQDAALIRVVHVAGSRLIPAAKLEAAMDLPLGQGVTYPRLQQALFALNQEYLGRGFAYCGVLSNAQVHYDEISSTLTVTVVEPRLHAVLWRGAPAGDPAVLLKSAGLTTGEVPQTAQIVKLMREAAGTHGISPPRPYLDPAGDAIDLEFTMQ